MQNALPITPFSPSNSDGKATFNVVIAYEDFESGKQAKRTADLLMEHLGDEFQFSNQMWKFDVLTVPKLRELAIRDAVAADIIVVSAQSRAELPSAVKTWLETAVTHGSQAAGLVGLFNEPDVFENPARTYLSSLAQTAGLEFFSQPGDLPHEGTPPASNSAWKGSKSLSILAEMTDRNPNISHWGINE